MTETIDYVRINDLTVACMRIGGVAPSPFVFVHGLGDSSIMTFAPIARHPELERFPSVLIDLPGFGSSAAPPDWRATVEQHAEAVAATLQALELRNVTIVGHSMGGSVSLLLASMVPERISTLILAEPLLLPAQSQLAKTIAKRREDDFVARGYQMLHRATRRQAARGDKAANGFLLPLACANPEILYRSAVSLLAERTPSFLERLAGIGIPRTLLIGERTDADMRIIPAGVTVVEVPNAGHSMMSENPDAFAQAIIASTSITAEGE